MTAAVAVSRRRLWRERVPVARAVALAIVVGIALFGALLLAASLLPASTLAARLLGVAGEADRAGAHTQDLLAHFGERLRFAGLACMALAAALAVLRSPFELMLRGTVADIRRGPRWQLAPGDVLVGGLVTAAALALRLVFVNQPMRYDEALTFTEFASRPLYYGLTYYPDPNNHLLNTLLVHVAFGALGNQPWVLRLPALLAGVLLVPATYVLARLVYPQRRATAVLAAVLVGASSYLVEYSTNSRGYTLQALCFVVVLALVQVAARQQSLSALLLAAVVGALGVYALPTMVYGVAVAAVWFVVSARSARGVPFVVGARSARGVPFVVGARSTRAMPALAVAGAVLALLALLLYLPVVLISGPESLVGNRFVVSLDASDLWQQLPGSLGRTWAFWNRDVPWVLAAVLFAGFVASIALDAREGRISLGVVAPVVCLVLVLLQRVAPFERVWLFLLPVYFVVAADGVVRVCGLAGAARVARSGRAAGVASGGRLAGNAGGVRGAGDAQSARGGAARFARGEWIAVVAAAAVMAVMAVTVVASGSILASSETGAFPDAEGVARSLRGELRPGDAVVTQVPASLPELQYYFPRAGLSTEPLVRDPSQATRLFVVAPAGAVPTVEGWGRPRTVAEFATAELVELTRS